MRSKRNYFWVILSEWSLKTLFIDESISPVSWYKLREFGSKSIRDEVIEDAYDYILLYSHQPKADYLLRVNVDLLDKARIEESIGRNTPLGYKGSIHLVRGSFEVYFSSVELKSSFIRRSKMILEIKPLDRWEEYMKLQSVYEASVVNTKMPQFSISFLNIESSIKCSKRFNSVKGGVYSLMYGLTKYRMKNENLLKQLRTYKNATIGIHSIISLFDGSNKEINIASVFDWESDFNKFSCNLPDDCQRLVKNIDSRIAKVHDLFTKLSDFLVTIDSTTQYESRKLMADLLRYENELRSIKEKEKRNGIEVGKSRLFFKKDSFEYKQKIYLKKEIITVKSQIKAITGFEYENKEQVLRNSLDEQFWAISTDLIGLEKRLSKESNSSFDTFLPDIDKLISFPARGESSILSARIVCELCELLHDECLMKTLLACLGSYQRGWTGDRSNDKILKILEYVGSRLKSEVDKVVLRHFYRFKKGDGNSFSFGENITLNSFIAFLLKPYDFQSLAKYCLGKENLDVRLAFLFFGLYNGYSALPGTLVKAVQGYDVGNRLFFKIDEIVNSSYLKC